MDREVLVYTGNRCKPCDAVKAFLKEKGFSYTEKNIHQDRDARQEVLAMGFKAVPVTVIGDHRIEGFDPAGLARALGI